MPLLKRYQYRSSDSPGALAKRLYGNSNLFPEILRANGGRVPTTGTTLRLPDLKRVQAGLAARKQSFGHQGGVAEAKPPVNYAAPSGQPPVGYGPNAYTYTPPVSPPPPPPAGMPTNYSQLAAQKPTSTPLSPQGYFTGRNLPPIRPQVPTTLGRPDSKPFTGITSTGQNSTTTQWGRGQIENPGLKYGQQTPRELPPTKPFTGIFNTGQTQGMNIYGDPVPGQKYGQQTPRTEFFGDDFTKYSTQQQYLANIRAQTPHNIRGEPLPEEIKKMQALPAYATYYPDPWQWLQTKPPEVVAPVVDEPVYYPGGGGYYPGGGGGGGGNPRVGVSRGAPTRYRPQSFAQSSSLPQGGRTPGRDLFSPSRTGLVTWRL